MKLKFTILALLILIGWELSAQNRTLKTSTEKIMMEEESDYTPTTETYTYYVGDNGENIKHGSYSKIGKRSFSGGDAYNTGSQTCNYSLKATYKDGELNGTVTGLRTCYTSVTNKFTNKVDTHSIKESFSGGYLLGIPNGVWKSSRIVNGKTTYSVTMTFKEGVLVGKYTHTYEGSTTSGSFDDEGNRNGEWTYGDTKETYARGVKLKEIFVNSKQEDKDLRSVQDRYAKGEATLEELRKEGYPIIDHKLSQRLGYDKCIDGNWLWIEKLTGDRTRYDSFYSRVDKKYIPIPIEKELILGREIEFKQLPLAKDEHFDAALAKMEYDIEADATIVDKIRSGSHSSYNNKYSFYIGIPIDEEEREEDYYGFAGRIEYFCGEGYPLQLYYCSDDQIEKYLKLKEAARIKAEEEARRKQEIIDNIRNSKDEINSTDEEIAEALETYINQNESPKQGFSAAWTKCHNEYTHLSDSSEASIDKLNRGIDVAKNILTLIKSDHSELVEGKVENIKEVSDIEKFILDEAMEIQKSEEVRYETIAKYRQQSLDISKLYQSKELTADQIYTKSKYYEKSSFIVCYLLIMIEIEDDLNMENLNMILNIGDMLTQIREPKTKTLERTAKKIETYSDAKAFFMNDVKTFCDTLGQE